MKSEGDQSPTIAELTWIVLASISILGIWCLMFGALWLVVLIILAIAKLFI